MSTITLRRPRSRAILTASALIAATLGFAAAPAQAADPVPAPSLKWAVSAYVANPAGQFADHTTAGGATETDRVVTFPNGVGSFDTATGKASVAYKGSFKAAGQGGSYSVTFADPTVTVDAAGEGTISADVTWAIGTTSTAGPTRLTVTTFDAAASDWTTSDGLRSLTKTPDWAGVLPPNTPESLAAGITNTARPVNGESFAPAFVTFLNAQIKAFFYSTGSNPASDLLKAPASFTAQAPIATISSSQITKQTPSSLDIAVTGQGYNPTGVGVYIALGETGLAAAAPASSYLGTVWSGNPATPAAAVKADGTFAAVVSLSPAEIATLDPSTSYSIYTLKAHGGNISDGSQSDNEAIEIDFADFAKATSVPTVVAAASTYGTASSVKVTVPTVDGLVPTGSVALTGAGTQSAELSDGSATFVLPAALSTGSKSLTASYSGDANYVATTGTVSKVVKAATISSIARGSTTKPTTKKAGKTTVALTSSTGAPVSGSVQVTFKKKGQTTKTKTAYVTNGTRVVTIPKLAKGTWTVSVKFLGSTNFARTATVKAGTFTVTK